MNLSDYLYLTQKFLRDSTSQFYPQDYLIKSINLARQDVIYAAKSTRALGLINLIEGVQQYTYDPILAALQAQNIQAQQILAILSLTVEYNNPSPAPLIPATQGILTYQLDYKPWSYFSAVYRAFPISIYPSIWAQYGDQAFYVAPIPSDTYILECDVLYMPPDLTQLSDQETAFVKPWTDLIPLAACYWAKFYEQSFQEAQNFQNMAAQIFGVRIGAKSNWKIPSQYGTTPT
jgi:hypothetical protein